MKTRKLCCADAFDDAAERSRVCNSLIVNFFAPGELHREEQTWVGTEFVDALAKPNTARMQKHVTTRLVERSGNPPDYRMLQRLFASEPENRRGSLRNDTRRDFHHRCIGIGLGIDLFLIGRGKNCRREMKDRCAIAAGNERTKDLATQKIQTQENGKLHASSKNRCVAGILPAGI